MKKEEVLQYSSLVLAYMGDANPHSSAKNADIVDYKYATGFEALIGYLYLTEQLERMEEIISLAIEIINAKK